MIIYRDSPEAAELPGTWWDHAHVRTDKNGWRIIDYCTEDQCDGEPTR